MRGGLKYATVSCLDKPLFNPVQWAQFSIKLGSHNRRQLQIEILYFMLQKQLLWSDAVLK